jgi:hypothetical protein
MISFCEILQVSGTLTHLNLVRIKPEIIQPGRVGSL